MKLKPPGRMTNAASQPLDCITRSAGTSWAGRPHSTLRFRRQSPSFALNHCKKGHPL